MNSLPHAKNKIKHDDQKKKKKSNTMWSKG